MSVSSRSTGAGGTKPAKRAVLPDVGGLHVDDARVVLASSGFEYVKIHYVESYESDHHVVQQEPGGGILVDTAREVSLDVARVNLVNYLPAVYQQTTSPTGESFIKGFLYIIQALSDKTTRRLDRLDKLFDPRTTDPEFLPWLGSWMSIALNRDWTELQTRQMLLAATQLFPYRGTARAITDFVKIYRRRREHTKVQDRCTFNDRNGHCHFAIDEPCPLFCGSVKSFSCECARRRHYSNSPDYSEPEARSHGLFHCLQ